MRVDLVQEVSSHAKSQRKAFQRLFVQANSDGIRLRRNGVGVSAPVTDLRLYCNINRLPPFMLAWQTGFREVVTLLRPEVPFANAIQSCVELGQGGSP